MQFQSKDDPEADSDANTSAALGIMNGMPGINFFTPGITEAIAAGQRTKVRNQQLREIDSLEQPELENYDDIRSSYAGDVNPSLYDNPEQATATLAQESPEGRAAQLAALQDIGRVTDQSVGSTQARRRQQ